MLIQMSSVRSADGTRIAFTHSGVGPPLVLVHGSANDHTCWTGLLPILAERFTVYAVDRRGRGGSGETDAAAYDIEREYEDVEAVIETIDEPVYLLGHSYGALCALEVAIQSTNLRGLILNEPPFRADPTQPISPPGALDRMKSRLDAGDVEGVTLTFGREIARLPEHEIEAVRSTPAWPAMIEMAPTLVYEVEAVESYRFDPARSSDLSTPVLLLLGSESPPFLKAATHALAAALPNSEVAVLEGQGHLAMHTGPDLLLREVTQFVTEN